jgi:hypothetical protein
MATKRTVTETHTCDMCGAERPREALITLSGPASRTTSADVCPECQSRPISEFLAVLRRNGTNW